MRVKTVKVYWKGKFNGAQVTINAEDFDPALHSTEAPKVEAKPKAQEAVQPVLAADKPAKAKASKPAAEKVKDADVN